MLTMTVLKELTEVAFDAGLAIPEPDISWKDKIEALQAAKLSMHVADAIFDMRCEQAATLGFQRITIAEMVVLLMGEPHTDEMSAKTERQDYEWTYDHHTDCVLSRPWGGIPYDYYHMAGANRWYVPPFLKKEKWRCRCGKLNYLKRTIPYGVVLRINELKPSKLFNVFNVLAPLEAWERKTDIDPVVVASIWSLPPDKDGGPPDSAGQVAHFFVAQW